MMSRALVLVTTTLFGCGDGGGFPDAPPIDSPAVPGTFTLAWTVADTASNPITCNQIGAQAVTALMRNHNIQGGSTEVFTCSTLMGMSMTLVAGTYDASFDLNGIGGDPVTGIIATAPSQLAFEIKAGENTVLAPLAFRVNATGGMKLKMQTSATVDNCATATGTNAGITTNTITVTKTSDGMCAPLLFNISAGAAGTPRTYMVDCTTPVVAACIERDQELTVAGVVSGSYGINVKANKATGTNCFTNIDQLPVPPLGREVVRTLNLAPSTPPCS